MVISGQKICRVKSSENPSKTGEYHHYIENVGPDSVKDSLKLVQIHFRDVQNVKPTKCIFLCTLRYFQLHICMLI